MTLSAIRHSMIDSILREPGNPLHRYALADSYEEHEPWLTPLIARLREQNGVWIVWHAGNIRYYLSRQLDSDSKYWGSSVVADLLNADVPECHTTKQIPLDGRPARKCAKDGRCQPFQRIASRHSNWQWCCPGAYARIRAPYVAGVYLA